MSAAEWAEIRAEMQTYWPWADPPAASAFEGVDAASVRAAFVVLRREGRDQPPTAAELRARALTLHRRRRRRARCGSMRRARLDRSTTTKGEPR